MAGHLRGIPPEPWPQIGPENSGFPPSFEQVALWLVPVLLVQLNAHILITRATVPTALAQGRPGIIHLNTLFAE
jgi:hypothetical protein